MNLQSIIIITYIVMLIGILNSLLIIILFIKNIKMKKRLLKFFPESKNCDIESMLNEYLSEVREVFKNEEKLILKIDENKKEMEEKIEKINNSIQYTNKKLKNAVQKVAMVRYNPFDEVGGELCYAIALLDENNNGIIINSIYGREACYSYAKEITNGECLKHSISEEERQALNIAIKK